MKQLLFLVILVAAGYYFFVGGVKHVLKKANISSDGLISNFTSKIDENFIPSIAAERKGFRYENPSSYNAVKDNVFMTYDPDVCFAFIDLAYSSGSNQAGPLIAEYLTMFTLPEDRAKILKLLTAYKDKQTLDILLSLYKSGSLERISLLNALSSYRVPEVAQIINRAASSEDLLLSQTAKRLADSFQEEKWYKEGLEATVETVSSQVSKKDFAGQMVQY